MLGTELGLELGMKLGTALGERLGPALGSRLGMKLGTLLGSELIHPLGIKHWAPHSDSAWYRTRGITQFQNKLEPPLGITTSNSMRYGCWKASSLSTSNIRHVF